MPENKIKTYSLPSKIIHWLIAAMIFTLLGVGFYMHSMTVSPLKWQLYSLHKAFGITVLFFVIVRAVSILIYPHPEALKSYARWEKILASIVKVLLWGCMIGIPMSGWVMSSAGGYPVSFFGLFTVPAIVDQNPEIGAIASETHETLAYSLIGFLLLHVSGALKHHFIDQDSTLSRMSLGNKSVVSLIIAALGFAFVVTGFLLSKIFLL